MLRFSHRWERCLLPEAVVVAPFHCNRRRLVAAAGPLRLSPAVGPNLVVSPSPSQASNDTSAMIALGYGCRCGPCGIQTTTTTERWVMGIREGTTGREPCDGLDSTGCGGFQFGPEITKKSVVLTCVTCFLKVLVLRNEVGLVVLGELRLVW